MTARNPWRPNKRRYRMPAGVMVGWIANTWKNIGRKACLPVWTAELEVMRLRWAARHACARLRAKLSASQAREARLREALEPFAESAREMVEFEEQEGFRYDDGLYPADICKFNAGELRRVLAALAADGEGGSDE